MASKVNASYQLTPLNQLGADTKAAFDKVVDDIDKFIAQAVRSAGGVGADLQGKGDNTRADIYVRVEKNENSEKMEPVALTPRTLHSGKEPKYDFGIYAKNGSKGSLVEAKGLTFQANCPAEGRSAALATVQTQFKRKDLKAAAFVDINGDGIADAIMKYQRGSTRAGYAVFLSTKCD